MLDLTSAKAGRLLSGTKTDIEQRKAIAGRADDNIPRITSLKSIIEQRVDHCAEVFFNHVVKIAAPELFARRGVLDQAKPRTRGSPLNVAGARRGFRRAPLSSVSQPISRVLDGMQASPHARRPFL